MYDELFAAWKLEKNSEAIQPLPSGFFKKILGYISGLSEPQLHGKVGSNIEAAKSLELEYAKYMFSDLLEMRAKKIVSLSLGGQAEYTPNLLGSEAELVKSLHKLMKDYEEQCAPASGSENINAVESSKKRELSSPMDQNNSGLMLLRVLQHVPKLVGVDLDEYGPFQPEDIVYLPRENGLVLISRGAASEVKI